jgi:hypothetical protein
MGFLAVRLKPHPTHRWIRPWGHLGLGMEETTSFDRVITDIHLTLNTWSFSLTSFYFSQKDSKTINIRRTT